MSSDLLPSVTDRKKQTPEAFGVSSGDASSLQHTAQYLNDVYIYDVENCSWHAPITYIVATLGSTEPVQEVMGFV